MRLGEKLIEQFPTPAFLSMPAVGLDISDDTVKFVELVPTRRGQRVERYGERKIPKGIVTSGQIENSGKLSEILKGIQNDFGITHVRSSLPEERAYLFTTVAPNVSREEMRTAIEFKLEENVPITAASAVFDFDVVRTSPNREQVYAVVSVISEKDVRDYVELFTNANLIPLSLEIEAQAIARSIVAKGDRNSHIVVDFGRNRSGISIVENGIVSVTTTVGVGGEAISKLIMEYSKGGSVDRVDEIKNEEGLAYAENKDVAQGIKATVDALAEAIEKHHEYWKSHRDERNPSAEDINDVLLCGGSSNLMGLPEYLSSRLKMPVRRGNVWVNAFSEREYVPPIRARDALGFGPAIGLALHGA